MAHRLTFSLTGLLLACASLGVDAAELGEAKVSSYIGQQLVADIELTSIDEPGAKVEVRLASADVYRGAGLDMVPVLGSLRMSVMRRDGRQFLHVTSLKPVDSERLHLFLELADGAQRSVRQTTLWLSPDPAPPAPAAPPPAPIVPPAAPPAPPIRLASLAAAAPVRPAACRTHDDTAAVTACAALDTRNAVLRDQIVKLEGKVRDLHSAMQAKPRAAPLPVAKPAIKPRPAPAALQPESAQPRPAPAALQPEPAQGGAFPWAWIGGAGVAVFVLVGAAVAWLARRKLGLARRHAVVTPAEPKLE